MVEIEAVEVGDNDGAVVESGAVETEVVGEVAGEVVGKMVGTDVVGEVVMSECGRRQRRRGG